jgi:hypothetical protein
MSLCKYRRRLAANAHKYPQHIRLDPVRGWLIEPGLAESFFALKALPGAGTASLAEGHIVEADQA